MEMRRRRSKFRRRVQLYTRIGCVILLGAFLVLGGMKLFHIGPFNDRYVEKTGDDIDAARPPMQVELLTINNYSRPAIKVERIKGIVIHYTGNPGSTAMQNRNYFEGLKETKETSASSHFVVGLDGEIVQCIPTWEVAYASNNRNSDTISIETCHKTEDGSYTKATYESLVKLTAWLCKKYGLTEEDLIRHYDITGKNCPKYFVENEDAWYEFKRDVGKAIKRI